MAAFAAAALLAACQGNIGTGSGLPAAPGQGVAPGQSGAGGAGSQSRQRVVEGAVYLTPQTGEIPLPTLGDFSITLDLASAPPASSGASTGPASPSAPASVTSLRTKTSERVPALADVPNAAGSAAPSGEASSPSGAVTTGPSAGPLPSAAASPAPSGAASSLPSSAPLRGGGRGNKSGPSPSPTPSGAKIDTKLTVYPEDAPPVPTPAPTGNVQTYLKRVALVRGFVLSRADLTLYGLGAVRFTIPSSELTPNRGFTVAVYDQSKKHHDRLVAWDTNAALSGATISATASPSSIPLKKGVGYAFLLYGDELAPAAPASGSSYPPPGNNPFVTPPPAGAAPNPYASAPANNPYATPTPYNPNATPTPYTPYVPTIPPPH